MMKQETLVNPSVSQQVLADAGVVRIPFSPLNLNICDMLESYCEDLIAPADYRVIRGKIAAYQKDDINHSWLYIFKPEHHKIFLQMISLENVFSGGKITSTDSHEVLYSTQQDCGYDKCPVFSALNKEVFSSIETTGYNRAFDSKHLHFVRIGTKIQTLGKMSSSITEYNLYLPY